MDRIQLLANGQEFVVADGKKASHKLSLCNGLDETDEGVGGEEPAPRSAVLSTLLQIQQQGIEL